MFGKYDSSSMCIKVILSLDSAGKTTGIFTDSEDGLSHIMRTYEGYQIPKAIEKYSLQTLKDDDYYFEATVEKENAREIKEKLS
ncbi:unnamed protein product [Moneuplotes crassus]|uniref:Uncharacterized protein n=1 Tax=Euplotes crassus TaxID=5936 RepID=A0AAD1XX07_EUPCR|nr:unnamed protein product [Moneuplotes crassus]